MEGGGKVEKEKKVPKKIQETRQSSHTNTHAKRHKSPPKNPTVTLRIHTHTHTHNPVECHVDTPDRKYNEIRRWMCLFKSFRKKKKL